MGEKLQKTTNSSKGVTTTVDYCGNIEYENGELAAIHHSTGRIIPEKGGGFRYQFQLTDHLGNVRILFEDKDQSGNITKRNPEGGSKNPFIIDEEEIIVINHYYPFGLQMTGPVNPWFGGVNGRKYDYSYNGKELNDDFGLDWSDYGARWYDATIGRWGAVDPLAESYAGWSPYNYVLGNPIKFIDPDGMKVKHNKIGDFFRTMWGRLTNKSFRSEFRELRRSEETYVFNGSKKLGEGILGSFTTDGNQLFINYTYGKPKEFDGGGKLGILFAETRHATQFQNGQAGFVSEDGGSTWRGFNYDVFDEIDSKDARWSKVKSSSFEEVTSVYGHTSETNTDAYLWNVSSLDEKVDQVLNIYGYNLSTESNQVNATSGRVQTSTHFYLPFVNGSVKLNGVPIIKTAAPKVSPSIKLNNPNKYQDQWNH